MRCWGICRPRPGAKTRRAVGLFWARRMPYHCQGGTIIRLLKCVLLLLISLEAALAGAPQDDKRPYRIGRIIIHRREVFDGRHADWFGSLVNKFHILTREDIIRNEL